MTLLKRLKTLYTYIERRGKNKAASVWREGAIKCKKGFMLSRIVKTVQRLQCALRITLAPLDVHHIDDDNKDDVGEGNNSVPFLHSFREYARS